MQVQVKCLFILKSSTDLKIPQIINLTVNQLGKNKYGENMDKVM